MRKLCDQDTTKLVQKNDGVLRTDSELIYCVACPKVVATTFSVLLEICIGV